ncbi:MAG: hypothetical protein ABMA14_11150 [Hyphomonadaceae bacterium]
MNALLFGLMSTALMGVAVARGPEAVEAKPVPAAHIEQIRAQTTLARPGVSEVAKAAADDLEVARLMEAAPDVGEFGDSVIVDADTGVETRVSGIGFSDK